MTNAGRIFCLGDAMVDILATLPGPLAVGSDTPAPVRFRHGGAAANTASWLAASGARAVFVGRVGDDAFGRDVTATLRSCGVEVQAGVDAQLSTGVCLVLVAPDGERTMIPSAGANDDLTLDDLTRLRFTTGDRLHLSGYSLLKSGPRPAAVQALIRAELAGIPVTVDAASADPIRSLGAQAFLDLVPHRAVLLANLDEARVLTGRDDPRSAAAELSRLFDAAVIKCGADGAVLGRSGEVHVIAGRAVAVLDSTGAGDAFAAGFVGALHAGAGLPAAVRAGNELGARAVTRLGARPV